MTWPGKSARSWAGPPRRPTKKPTATSPSYGRSISSGPEKERAPEGRPPGSSAKKPELDRPLLAEEIVGRVHLEAPHLLVHAGEDGPPDWLNDWPFILHELFDLFQDLLALFHVQGRIRRIHERIEVRIVEVGLIPWHACPVGEIEHHDAERAMGPRRVGERLDRPMVPVLCRWQDVHRHVDADVLPHIHHGLNRDRFPVRVLLAEDRAFEPVRHAGVGEELLRLFDIPLHRRQLVVVGMYGRDVVMLARCAEAE